MPFTPTHTLAAVPIAWLWSRHGTFSALLIGTMVPDWPLYVPFGPPYHLTHSFGGLFVACLPIGFSLAFLYHVALKRALFELLPDAVQARLVRYLDGPSIMRPAILAAIAAAVLIGAATHIVWDAFTHFGAWGVRLIPLLGETWLRIDGVDIPAYMVLQHGCTLVGFPLFLLLYANWYRNADVQDVPQALLAPLPRQIWRVVLLTVPGGMLVFTTVEFITYFPSRAAFSLLIHGVTRTGLAILVLFACFGLFFALTQRGKRRVAVRS